MDVTATIDTIGRGIEFVGIGAIVVGAALATVMFAMSLARRDPFEPTYRTYRQGLGRAILLGLEFLVAADIIRTVAISPTIESVVALGGIVLIRTALSFSLQLEIEGRWPWQRPVGVGAAVAERRPV
jgi:uncharacterized membrane protein